jgi:hypothetical protein
MRGAEGRNDIDEAVEVDVGGMSSAIMDAKAVIDDGGENACIASGLHVDFRVADEHGLVRLSAKFAKDGVYTKRIGFFAGETVSAVDGAKIFGEAEGFEDAHADAYGLVGEHSHGHGGKFAQRFGNAGISASIVHFVLFVMGEKKFQSAVEFFGVYVLAQGFGDEDGRAVADVAGNSFFRQLRAMQLAERGVYGMDQVELRIDERAVKIENQGANRGKILGGHWYVNILKHSEKNRNAGKSALERK